MDPMESVLYNGFEISDDNSHDDHGWKELVKHNGSETSDDNSHDDHVWKELVKYNGFDTSDANYREYHEWKEVVHGKRNRKQKKPADKAANGSVSGKIVPSGDIANGNNAFRLLDEQAMGRRPSEKMVAAAADVEEEPNSSGAAWNENVKAEETKKPNPKKKKKKKNKEVSLPEALANIDPLHLVDFLVKQVLEPSTSQLVEFVEYFEIALSEVSSVQFPWLEMFNNNCPLSNMIDVPLSHIPEPLYKASADWIDQLPSKTLSAFVQWASKNIQINLAEKQEVTIDCEKNEKNEFHETVAIYVALAMVLRSKPHSLIVLLPALWTEISAKYRKLDEVPFTVWMMDQASEGDLSVGLCSWAHTLLPLVGEKKCNAQSRDYILQLVENILSNPEARTILVNGTLCEGKRLIPPPAFEDLMRLTFPASSARVKDTERFEAIYPLLKEVALAGAPGSETMRQVTQELFTSCLKLAGEGNPVLAKEATAIAIWLVAVNTECLDLWDNLYEENVEASVALLRKLVDEWKDHSHKFSLLPSDTLTLKQTIKSFRLKNEKAITEGGDTASLYREADKSCKVISGRLSRGNGCLIGTAITAVVLAAAGAASAIMKVSFL